MKGLGNRSVGELARRIEARELSSEELVKDCLARIEAENPRLNAFVAVYAEEALEAARAADRALASGRSRGPLHGIPVGIKDNCDIAGKPTTAACAAFQDNVPAADSDCVRRLRDAGAILIGKTNMHELAYGGTGEVSSFGPARNPWNPECIAGGSSSGSGAAVAAGLVPAALGSDTGGSIRIPAAACGVTGFKGSYGLVSRAGVMPLSWSLDHVGPLAGSVDDCLIVLEALAERETASPEEPASRLGVARFPSYGLDPEVERAVEAALADMRELGYRLEEFTLADATEAHVSWLGIMYPEAASCYQDALAERFDDFAPAVRTQLEAGRYITAQQYLNAQRFRGHYIRTFETLSKRYDAILMPSLPVPAPRLGQKKVELPTGTVTTQDAMTFTNLTADMLGWPCVTVPCGFSEGGLPIGLSVMTPAFTEMRAAAIASRFQQATDWCFRVP